MVLEYLHPRNPGTFQSSLNTYIKQQVVEYVELNPKGNFDNWECSKVKELNAKSVSEHLGEELLYENRNMKVWSVTLLPDERLPFRRINSNYCYVSMTKGLAITHNGNGEITLLRLAEGDSSFMQMEGREAIHDLENIGENILMLHIMEFKPMIKETNAILKML